MQTRFLCENEEIQMVQEKALEVIPETYICIFGIMVFIKLHNI